MKGVSFKIIDGGICRCIKIGKRAFSSALPIPDDINHNQPLEDLYDISWLASKKLPKVYKPLGVVRVVDLFCGCGGLTLGIREACRGIGRKFEAVFASDINKHALSIYESNFKPQFLSADPIETSIDGGLGAELTQAERRFVEKIGRIDILVAGPPCQGNSNLNNYTRRDDPKNLLYLRAVRCAEILRPASVIIENVPGVKYEKHGVLQTAEQFLLGLGYHVDCAVVPMRMIGVPQTRKRMILIASLASDIKIKNVVAEAKMAERPLSWACGDLLEKYDAGSTFDSSAAHSLTNQARIHYLFEHDLYNLPDDQRPDCHRLKPHTYPAVYGRMWWDRPAPTLTSGFGCCGRGRFVHPLRERTLTPHEAARLQYFPDFFDFSNMGRTGMALAIGNAVPARAGYVLAIPLLRAAFENSDIGSSENGHDGA